MLKRWKKRISPFLIAILTFTMSSAVDVQSLIVYADEQQADAEARVAIEEDGALEDNTNEIAEDAADENNPDEENPGEENPNEKTPDEENLEITEKEPGENAELGEAADVEPPEAGAAEALDAVLEEPDRVGSGTADSPYEITTEADLIALANGEFNNNFSAFYILKNDIALTAAEWTPIGDRQEFFSGTFDGSGHTITGINITGEQRNDAGLFGYVTGTIKNLGVDGTVSELHYVGVLAGLLADGGLVHQCWSAGSAASSTDGSVVGGLVGYNAGTIEQSYTTAAGSATGTSYIGGLVGENYGTIQYCYARGKATGSTANTFVGGLVGAPSEESAIKYSYATGAVTSIGTMYMGGLVSGGVGTAFTANYYDKQATGQSDTTGAIPLTTIQSKNKASYVDWDFTDMWDIGSAKNAGYPYLRGNIPADEEALGGDGTADSPYEIITQADLIALANGEFNNNFSAFYILKNDITLTAAEWTPIGDIGGAFSGTFDGSGYTITDINITRDQFNYAGLFGYVTGTIKNLGVDGTISGMQDSGMLAGILEENGLVHQCWSAGSAESSTSTGSVGGLVGTSAGTIEQSYTTAACSVTGINYTGGLVGLNYTNGTIQHCYARGKATGSTADAIVGGLVGGTLGGAIKYSYATGTVTGTYLVGGLAAWRATTRAATPLSPPTTTINKPQDKAILPERFRLPPFNRKTNQAIPAGILQICGI